MNAASSEGHIETVVARVPSRLLSALWVITAVTSPGFLVKIAHDHAQAAQFIGSLDHMLGDVVEGGPED